MSDLEKQGSEGLVPLTDLEKECYQKIDRMEFGLADLLKFAIDVGVSDLHVVTNQPLSYRYKRDIKKVPIKMRVENINQIVGEITASSASLVKLYKPEELDGSYRFRYKGQEWFFRYNICLSVSEPHLTIRKLINKIPSFEDVSLVPNKGLKFAQEVQKLAHGIYLVVGETGSGKTTTLVSIISSLLEQNHIKVVTLEAPIEFYYNPNIYDKSIIIQREIGLDSNSFLSGLRAAMRQDPDVILVGEIRDEATAVAALQASQSGHIVLATLHANGPEDAKARLHNMLAGQNGFEDSLQAAMWQKLYKNSEGEVEVERKWEIFFPH